MYSKREMTSSEAWLSNTRQGRAEQQKQNALLWAVKLCSAYRVATTQHGTDICT